MVSFLVKQGDNVMSSFLFQLTAAIVTCLSVEHLIGMKTTCNDRGCGFPVTSFETEGSFDRSHDKHQLQAPMTMYFYKRFFLTAQESAKGIELIIFSDQNSVVLL